MTPFTLHLHQETHRDLLVSTDGDAERAFWLRRDHVEVGVREGCRVVVNVPDWLARERGIG